MIPIHKILRFLWALARPVYRQLSLFLSLLLLWAPRTLASIPGFASRGVFGSDYGMRVLTSQGIAFLLADHGEEVWDYRDHSSRDFDLWETPEFMHCQNDIPFMVWFSPACRQHHPEVVARVQKATGRPFTNDDLSNLLFHLARITTPYYNTWRNPLSDKFKLLHRKVYDKYDYDPIVKRPDK